MPQQPELVQIAVFLRGREAPVADENKKEDVKEGAKTDGGDDDGDVVVVS